MAAMVWMACQDRECPIKLLSRYHRGQLVRQRNPAEGNGLVGSRQEPRGLHPSAGPTRKQQLLYSVVLEGSEHTPLSHRTELLAPAIREYEHGTSS